MKLNILLEMLAQLKLDNDILISRRNHILTKDEVVKLYKQYKDNKTKFIAAIETAIGDSISSLDYKLIENIIKEKLHINKLF